MNRNTFQDMAPRRTPREIGEIYPRRIKKEDREENKPKEKLVFERKNRNSRPYRLFLVAILAVLFMLFALSYLFALAKITITPKTSELALNADFTAVKNAKELSFDLVVISGEEKKEIVAEKEKETAITAKGTVIVYNNFSNASQILAVDTRLEGSNGKIYKTTKKVTIPGMQGNKPGNIEVGIYANEAGENYNSDPLDFKILGFKGTPKYEKFYARSKGKISGGFIGRSPVLSDLDKVATANELKKNLEEKLAQKVKDQIPKDFILYPKAVSIQVEEQNTQFINNEGKNYAVLKGTLYGLLFNEKKLAKEIAQKIVEKYNGEDIYITNLKDLTFTLLDKDISLAEAKNIQFNLSGTPKIVWQVDGNKLALEILGKKKKDFNQILTNYPNIKTAELSIRPFWKSSFPEKAKDIKITVSYP